MMVAKTSWVRYRTPGGALAVKKSVVIDCEVWTLNLEKSNSELTEGKINENDSEKVTDCHQSMKKIWAPESHTGKQKLDIISMLVVIQYKLQI